MKNKILLITGATSGLGKSLVINLANDAELIIAVGRNREVLSELEATLNNIVAIECDFESAESKKVFFERLEEFDISAVVHCLGGGFKLGHDLLSSESFMRLFNLNFLISTEINAKLVPEMEARGRGWIVHIGSIASREVTASVGYTSIKAIIPAYVKALGRRLIKKGIFVSCLMPGGMMGENGSMDRLRVIKSDVVSEFVQNRRPSGKLSDVNMYVKWVQMLLDENASLHASNTIILDEAESISI